MTQLYLWSKDTESHANMCMNHLDHTPPPPPPPPPPPLKVTRMSSLMAGSSMQQFSTFMLWLLLPFNFSWQLQLVVTVGMVLVCLWRLQTLTSQYILQLFSSFTSSSISPPPSVFILLSHTAQSRTKTWQSTEESSS